MISSTSYIYMIRRGNRNKEVGEEKGRAIQTFKKAMISSPAISFSSEEALRSCHCRS